MLQGYCAGTRERGTWSTTASAGGHVAACTGVIKKFDESSEDESISSVPNAMVLFNPACVLAAVGDRQPFDKNRLLAMPQRMGVKPIELSPYHHVAKGAPPTIMFHGKAYAPILTVVSSQATLEGLYFHFPFQGDVQWVASRVGESISRSLVVVLTQKT